MTQLHAIFCVLMALTTNASGTANPMPLPKNIRVESAASRERVWQKLSENQKNLAYHLMEASREGRGLLMYQLHRHGLLLKSFFEDTLDKKNLEITKKALGPEGFQEFLVYAAKFSDLGGPYANSNRKYIFKTVKADKLEPLLAKHLPSADAKTKAEILKLLTDPNFELMLFPEGQDGEGLELTGGNFYEKGITGSEVKNVLDKTLKTTLNCRVVRQKGTLTCEMQTINTKGIVGEKLKKIVAHLEAAKPFAEHPHQRSQIEHMVRYFTDGDVADFRKANIEWVRLGSKATVDFMIGWVEVYEDYLARIGTWESYVQIVDPEVTRVAQALATHAQAFENAMPYGEFKKKFPDNYSPPAIMVYYFQELANYRSGGYNLPNFDDIRRDYGAKNVIRLPLPGESEDPDIKATYQEMLNEFLPQSKVASTLSKREKLYRVLVLLHEIIGHGSGTYDVSKYGKNEDPISGLGNLGSALEEQRADLTALVFGGDPILVEVGLYKDAKEAKETHHAMYDYYLADFLRRTSGQRTFSEAHQRGHLLFVSALLEAGAVDWINKNGKSEHKPENAVLFVKDYDKFKKVATDQLAELQRIKAVRDVEGLKRIFDRYAPLDTITAPWAQAVIKRGENLKINAGYVEQPWRVSKSLKFESYGGKTLESTAPFWKGLY